MVFQRLIYFAADTVADRRRGIMVKIDAPVETKNMFQEL